MADILELVFEYRRLLARRDLMGGAMSADSEERLVGLERLFGSDPDDRLRSSRRRFARCELRVPATIRTGDRVEPVDIVDVGGGGVRVEPAPLLRRGERATIRIVSPERNAMYVYHVEASWSERTAERSTMGLPFVGTPEQLALAA